MTATRPDRLGADKSAADQPNSEKLGPERYAPVRRNPERLGEIDQAAATAFEGEIREFVRRDVSFLRRQRPDNAVEPADAGNGAGVNAMIKRVSSASMEEIDRVILELQGVRDMLRNEGERVTREISGFASLSHAAITSMRVIAESLEQWKNGPGPRQSH